MLWRKLAMQDGAKNTYEAAIQQSLNLLTFLYQPWVKLYHTLYNVGILRPKELINSTVISVGNLTVGGTGKTPCVEYLAKQFEEMRKKPAVLTRGYRGPRQQYCLMNRGSKLHIEPASIKTQSLADEPQLLASNLPDIPVVVSPNRYRSGLWVQEEHGANVMILDDGFQHRALKRNLDIVLIDASMPIGGWRLFPRGLMRETIKACRRAQVVCLTKVDQNPEGVTALHESLRQQFRDLLVIQAQHTPEDFWDPKNSKSFPLETLAGSSVGLISSLGDPHGFEQTVKSHDFNPLWHCIFPDHHPYSDKDLEVIEKAIVQQKPEFLVTTEKDWVRLKPFMKSGTFKGIPVRLLRIRFQIVQGEAELNARLRSVLVS